MKTMQKQWERARKLFGISVGVVAFVALYMIVFSKNGIIEREHMRAILVSLESKLQDRKNALSVKEETLGQLQKNNPKTWARRAYRFGYSYPGEFVNRAPTSTNRYRTLKTPSYTPLHPNAHQSVSPEFGIQREQNAKHLH